MNNYLVRGALVATLALVVSACMTMTESERKQRHGVPSTEVVGSAIQGQQLYAGNCAFCHGKQMQGSRMGPPLKHKMYAPDQLSDEAIYRAIKLGAKQRHWRFGAMPSRSYIRPEKAAHVVAYIRQAQQHSGIYQP
ncbi:MAG: cytochrome c [Halopseudomonas sp.]